MCNRRQNGQASVRSLVVSARSSSVKKNILRKQTTHTLCPQPAGSSTIVLFSSKHMPHSSATGNSMMLRFLPKTMLQFMQRPRGKRVNKLEEVQLHTRHDSDSRPGCIDEHTYHQLCMSSHHQHHHQSSVSNTNHRRCTSFYTRRNHGRRAIKMSLSYMCITDSAQINLI